MRDAVIAGIHLNIFNNHSDRVRIANIAQAVNVLQSPVLTEGDKMVLTPTWHIFHMFKDHQDARLLETTFASVSAGLYDKDIMVPGLSVSASEKKNEKNGKNTCLVTIVNTDCKASNTIEITFANDGKAVENPQASLIAAADMRTCNTFEKPEEVVEKSLAVTRISKDTLSIEMPANSVASVRVEL